MGKWQEELLSRELLDGLAALGYDEPTAVQKQVIPQVLAGCDVIVQSDTGSGKTLAFGIPLCERVERTRSEVQALVVVPTRELAVQVQEEIATVGRFKQVRTLAVYGRQPIARQTDRLRQGAQVVVGTPGRLLDHLERGNLSLQALRMLVIDEADKMLEMGFWEQVEAIIAQTPVKRQVLLFSATIPERVRLLGEQCMSQPSWLQVETACPAAVLVEQSCCLVAAEEKASAVEAWLCALQPERCLVFCNTRAQADEVQLFLAGRGYAAAVLHGGMEQRSRLQTLEDFRQGRIWALVATDVAGRGIHVEAVELVISCDLPEAKETYTHRIGRTGRAGQHGRALQLVTPEEDVLLAALEVYLGAALPKEALPDREAVENGRKVLLERTPRIDAAEPSVSKLRINGGKQKKIRPGDLVGAISHIPGVAAADIGVIDVQETCSYVEILGGKGALVLAGLASAPVKGRLYKAKFV